MNSRRKDGEIDDTKGGDETHESTTVTQRVVTKLTNAKGFVEDVNNKKMHEIDGAPSIECET